MDTVGNMGDGDLIFGSSRPNMRPHAPGHFSVQFTDPVAVLRHAQPQNKHGKRGA